MLNIVDDATGKTFALLDEGRHFLKDIILMAVRWYVSHSLSHKDIEELMAERGIRVDHTTIHR